MGEKKLRVLALHSFRTSAAIFKEQLQRSGLDTALADLIELTFIDAPNAASGPIPDDVQPFFSGPYYEWWNAQRDSLTGKWSYDGWERSLQHITDVVALHGPFDGLMGFSQGGAATALLIGMQRSGHALQNTPRFKFCVCFAGIRARDESLEKCYAAMRDCPSLHIIGDKDPVRGMTNHLIASFDHPVVVHHSRGHVIPALQGPELQRVRAFLEAQRHEASL